MKQLEAMGFVKGSETVDKENYVTFTKKASFKTTDELKSMLTDNAKYKKTFLLI